MTTKSKKSKTKTVEKSAPAHTSTPAPVLIKSEAEKIWDEIKGLPIAMFGLPNQVVAQHCVVATVEPSQLYLLLKSSAVLPSLEASIAPKFTVELLGKYVAVKRASNKIG